MPSTSQETTPPHAMSSEKPATHCGGCAVPLPWAALGLGSRILMFHNVDPNKDDLCGRCLLNYYYRTGALGVGGGSSTGVPHPTCPFPFARAGAAASAAGEEEEEKKRVAPPGSGRCAACRKKVWVCLLGFVCRCGGTFCAAHRHAESHGCRFDYKEFGRKRVARENPLVVAPKVAKISTATVK